MALPDLVLIHGGGHAADCWDLTIAELRSTAAELRVYASTCPAVEASRATYAARPSVTERIRLSVISIRPAWPGLS